MLKHDPDYSLEMWVKGVILTRAGGAEYNMGDAKYGANSFMIKF